MRLNGEFIPLNLVDGYAVIQRKWESGDWLELNLPMLVKQVITNPMVEENRNKVAFEYGPLVYCAEQADNGDISELMIPADVNFSVCDYNVSDEATKALVASFNETKLTLIPYYTWSNRGEGQMKVWFQQKN
jgi:hypothetical protein